MRLGKWRMADAARLMVNFRQSALCSTLTSCQEQLTRRDEPAIVAN